MPSASDIVGDLITYGIKGAVIIGLAATGAQINDRFSGRRYEAPRAEAPAVPGSGPAAGGSASSGIPHYPPGYLQVVGDGNIYETSPSALGATDRYLEFVAQDMSLGTTPDTAGRAPRYRFRLHFISSGQATGFVTDLNGNGRVFRLDLDAARRPTEERLDYATTDMDPSTVWVRPDRIVRVDLRAPDDAQATARRNRLIQLTRPTHGS